MLNKEAVDARTRLVGGFGAAFAGVSGPCCGERDHLAQKFDICSTEYLTFAWYLSII